MNTTPKFIGDLTGHKIGQLHCRRASVRASIATSGNDVVIKAVATLCAAALLVSASQAQYTLTNGLICYYQFNGNANDALGNGNPGTLYNGAYFTNGISCQTNAAVYINGSGAYVYMGKNDAVYPNQVLTWTVWFKPEQINPPILPAPDSVFWDDDWQPNGDRGIALTTLADPVAGNYVTPPGFPELPLSTTNALALNVWHQAVFTSDTNGQNLFIDGVLVASTNVIIANHAGRSSVSYGAGNFNQTASGPNYVYEWGFKGAISNSRIYNRALSPSEVILLYNIEGGETPTITQQPTSITTNERANVVFTLVAAGSPPFNYQWQFNNSDLPGATNASLAISNVSVAQAGNYQVLLTNCFGSTTSQVATLTVTNSATPPVITQQPASVITNQGAAVAFSVMATAATPLSYQWTFDGTSIANATNSTLTLPGAQSSDAGFYSVLVTNAAGSTMSSNAFLTVITQQPVNMITNQGSNVTFTMGVAGSSLSYQWQFNGTNLSNSANLTGTSTATLTLSDTAATNIGYYSVVVSSAAGTATSAMASLTFLDLKTYAGITISSPVPTNYDLQAIPALGGTNWTTLTNVTLSNQPYLYIDYNTPSNAMQFYRAVQLP